MSVQAIWTKGKYKCTGFGKSVGSKGGILCREWYNGHATGQGAKIANKGHFCEKIERGTNGTGDKWKDWSWALKN